MGIIRKGTFSIQEIEVILKPIVLENLNLPKKLKGKNTIEVTIDNEQIHALSDRYKLFFTQGYKCVACGIEGKFWALEKTEGQYRYHLNLYGYDSEGNEELMTKDHIIEKSKGGTNKLENYQAMCETCNMAKSGMVNNKKSKNNSTINNKESKNKKRNRNSEKFLIKYINKYLNIKISNLKMFFVENPIEAKGYTKTSGTKYLKELFENNILEDKNINNYRFVKKSKEMYG